MGTFIKTEIANLNTVASVDLCPSSEYPSDSIAQN